MADLPTPTTLGAAWSHVRSECLVRGRGAERPGC